MDIQKAIEKIAGLARASQCSMFDIVAYDTFSESVEVFEKKITNTEIQESKALGIRVFKNSCPGIAFTEKLTEDALKTCLADALSHTAITSPISFQLPKPTALIAKDFNRLSPDFNQYSFSDLIHFATKLEDNVRSADARIENVPYTGAGRSSVTVHFLNSEHVRHVHTDQDFSAYSAAVLSFEAQKKMGFYSNSRLSFADLKNLPIAALTVERTLQQLGAKPVKAGKYRVLFSNRVSGQIMAMYSSAFFAFEALRSQSRLKGRLGEKIAAPPLTLSSLALREDLRGATPLDGEGMRTQNIHVVEKGIFTHFLYNLEAAAMEKKESTGNGVRSIGSKAGTAFKNLVVEKGALSAKEILSQGEILFIDKLDGAAGCSSISGEFSIGAHGRLYQNGEVVHAVDRITLSDNFFTMIQNIEAVSSEYNDQYSSVRVPDILVGGIQVAG